MAKLKENPLVTHGVKVFLSQDSRAFENRTKYRGRFAYYYSKIPTAEFNSWMASHCGPMGALWYAVKNHELEGQDIYFAVKAQALLFKLTWGGR